MIRLFFSFYVILLGSILAHQYFGATAEDSLIREWLVHDKTNDFVGEMYLLDVLQQMVGDEELKNIVADYPAPSNIPVELLRFDQVNIPEQDLASLKEGETYVENPSAAVLYAKLSKSDLVVRMGPLGTYEPLDTIRNRYQQAIFIVLAVSVFLWMFVLQSKLKRIEFGATKLGEGDFSARVSEKGKHRVGRLNHSFNRMAERLERLILGHKSLTNAVAHELRTPVSRIRFQLDMLYEETDAGQRDEYMYGMSDNINELTDLVDELLTYARFDREAPAIDMHPHSLHQSLINVVAAAEIDSSIHVNYDDRWVQADPEQQFLPFEPKYLERAVGNILSNAQKYSRSKVQISVRRTADECTVVIDDDGPGIPEEDRVEIFEPFRRLDNSRTRSTGGHGLGLAIVKQIAEWHSGSVRIEQSPLGGARFSLVWPISAA